MTAQTLTLTDFLLARIAEDEAGEIQTETVLDGYLGGKRKTLIRHTRVEPSPRWLAECEAKRQIVEWHSGTREFWHPGADGEAVCDVSCAECRRTTPCGTLRALALPYADHPDYRAEWAL